MLTYPIEAPLAVQSQIGASAPAATASYDEGDSDGAAGGHQVQAIEDGPRLAVTEGLEDQPEATRTRLDREALTSELTLEIVDDGSCDTPLDGHLQSTGVTTNDPRLRLAISLAEQVSRTRSRSRGHEATASLAYAFTAPRISDEEIVGRVRGMP